MANDVTTPTDQRPYDPIQMLSDYLADNRNTKPNFRNFLINRLGDQIKWYDKKSGHFKRKWEGYRRTIIILSACIPFLVGLMDQAYLPVNFNIGLKMLIGGSGVAIAVLEGLNALYKSQELYIAYRVTAERLRHEFSSFIGQVGEYASGDDAAFSALVAKIEGILASENSQWADLARKTERASMTEGVEAVVKDYLEKAGFKVPEPQGSGGGAANTQSGDTNTADNTSNTGTDASAGATTTTGTDPNAPASGTTEGIDPTAGNGNPGNTGTGDSGTGTTGTTDNSGGGAGNG